MRKIAVVCSIILYSTLFLSAEISEKKLFALNDILDPETVNLLLKKRNLSRQIYKDPNPVLLFAPKTELGNKAHTVWNQPKKPVYCGELLSLVEKNTSENDIEKAIRTMQAISTMEGILYYSSTRRKIDILYPFCYMIDNPVNKNKIPDITGPLAENRPYFFYQKDNSLGKCAYELYFSRGEAEVAICSENYDPLKVALFTAIEAHYLQIHISVIDIGSDFLLYILVQAVFPTTYGYENLMSKSFSSRADALSIWFSDNYHKAR
jgi:hypothetical protein